MEITIKINGRMVTVEVSTEVAEYMDANKHKAENYDCGNCLLLDDGEECVCVPEHHILTDQMVPHRRSATGRWPVCCHAPSGRYEEMRPMRRLLPAKVQSGEVLSGVRCCGSPEEGGRAST